MANIVVTSTTNSIKVDFGDYYPDSLQFSKGTWTKDKITSILQDSVVKINVLGEKEWLVSYDGAAGSFQVDSVDAAAPSDNADLYNKLVALLG